MEETQGNHWSINFDCLPSQTKEILYKIQKRLLTLGLKSEKVSKVVQRADGQIVSHFCDYELIIYTNRRKKNGTKRKIRISLSQNRGPSVITVVGLGCPDYEKAQNFLRGFVSHYSKRRIFSKQEF